MKEAADGTGLRLAVAGGVSCMHESGLVSVVQMWKCKDQSPSLTTSEPGAIR